MAHRTGFRGAGKLRQSFAVPRLSSSHWATTHLSCVLPSRSRSVQRAMWQGRPFRQTTGSRQPSRPWRRPQPRRSAAARTSKLRASTRPTQRRKCSDAERSWKQLSRQRQGRGARTSSETIRSPAACRMPVSARLP
eukprot:5157930-Alexandrium_andersonii.AAC.1